jgi:hypothetical protein
MFFDDATIMGRTLLVFGFISAAKQILKRWEIVSQATGRYRRARSILAIALRDTGAGGLSSSARTAAETRANLRTRRKPSALRCAGK